LVQSTQINAAFLPGINRFTPRRALPLWPAVLAAAVLVLEANPVAASFGGRLDLSPGFFFVGAASVATPGALLCMIAEWVGSRHRPPLWIGNAALGLAVCCLLIAQRVIGPGGDSGLFVVFLPPLMTLALVSLLPAPAWRLMAVWCVAAGVAAVFLLRPPVPDPTAATVQGLRALLLGGALVSMLLWHLGFWLGQRSRRRAGFAPASAPDLSRALEFSIDGLKRGYTHGSRWMSQTGASAGPFRWLQEHPGFSWWLGGATVFHAGIAALTALGYMSVLMAALQGEALVADLLGLAIDTPNALTAGTWATTASSGRWSRGGVPGVRRQRPAGSTRVGSRHFG
jgi:hypothetical protein